MMNGTTNIAIGRTGTQHGMSRKRSKDWIRSTKFTEQRTRDTKKHTEA